MTMQEWKNALDTDIQFMVYEKTNIVFTAISAAKTLANEENGYLWLATSNHYGMIFNDIVTRRFSSLGENLACSNLPNKWAADSYTTLYPRSATARAMQADRKVFPRPVPPTNSRFPAWGVKVRAYRRQFWKFRSIMVRGLAPYLGSTRSG